MVVKPWLWVPPQWIHHFAPLFLKIYSSLFSSPTPHWKSVSWRHLYFPNPLGTAGGLDKNAKQIKDWWSLQAGFCEIGTITPKAQKINPSKTIDRNLKYLSLWNHMGFPNKGLQFVKKQLLSLPEKKQTPILINIGKNRDTSTEESIEDYKKCLEELHPFADIFVINISSPNTKNLRTLFHEDTLFSFLKTLKDFSMTLNPKIPLLLKLSPDETKQDFFRILDQSLESHIDGWCLCNSTSKRTIPNLFPAHGGVSGKLLEKQSLSLLKDLKKYVERKNAKDKLIVSCGGVLTPEEVLNRLKEGAHLVQVYSAIIFQGPDFFKNVFKYVSKLEKPL